MPIYNSRENDILNSLEQTYKDMKINEVAAYQPPPQPPAAPAQQQMAQQPESRKAPTASKKGSNLTTGIGSQLGSLFDKAGPGNGKHVGSAFDLGGKHTAGHFDDSNLAGALGMEQGGNLSSVVVDHDRGIVNRFNDGFPKIIQRAGGKVDTSTNYDAANPIPSKPDMGGNYSGTPIEKDSFGRTQGAMGDYIRQYGDSENQLPYTDSDAHMSLGNADMTMNQRYRDVTGATTRGPRNYSGKAGRFSKGKGY